MGKHSHTCYMDGGSIYSSITGCIIEDPALLVDKSADCLHGWGNMSSVEPKFANMAYGYSQAGMTDMLNDLRLIELSKFKVDRETACYILRRATEFTATGFLTALCEHLEDDSDPIAWIRSEMERIPIDVNEKDWGR